METTKKIKQPFKVGQRIFEKQHGYEATVTAHTKRGFKYTFDKFYSIVPRWNWRIEKGAEGECFELGFDGWEKNTGKNKITPPQCYVGPTPFWQQAAAAVKNG